MARTRGDGRGFGDGFSSSSNTASLTLAPLSTLFRSNTLFILHHAYFRGDERTISGGATCSGRLM
eukprot:2755386-Rhodomonas_salina.3